MNVLEEFGRSLDSKLQRSLKVRWQVQEVAVIGYQEFDPPYGCGGENHVVVWITAFAKPATQLDESGTRISLKAGPPSIDDCWSQFEHFSKDAKILLNQFIGNDELKSLLQPQAQHFLIRAFWIQ